MKRLLAIFVCGVAGLSFASNIDDAAAAVKEAQKSSDDCKGIATKLKLSLDAIESARKSPALVKQAKGRVEVAKDFAEKSCSDAAKAKVTEQLAAAITALDGAATPKKEEKTGAAFQAACKANDDCASDHCYIDDPAGAYCTKVCTAPSDCPAKWTCRRVGSLPDKLCIR